MERINIDTLPETNVDWYADGERANAVVLNRPIKQVAGIVNELIDTVEAVAGQVSSFASLAAFPATGVANMSYLDLATGKLYIWNGTAYVESKSQAELSTLIAAKQDKLVSGTNIKKIAGQSILGSGNIDVNALISADLNDTIAAKQDKLVSGTNIKTINGESLLSSGDVVLDATRVGAQPAMTQATQAEMAAGVETGVRSMSPLLIRKAIESVKAKSYFMGQI